MDQPENMGVKTWGKKCGIRATCITGEAMRVNTFFKGENVIDKRESWK